MLRRRYCRYFADAVARYYAIFTCWLFSPLFFIDYGCRFHIAAVVLLILHFALITPLSPLIAIFAVGAATLVSRHYYDAALRYYAPYLIFSCR